MSMANFDIANQRVENNEENNKIDPKTADEYAKNVIKQYEEDVKDMEAPVQEPVQTPPVVEEEFYFQEEIKKEEKPKTHNDNFKPATQYYKNDTSALKGIDNNIYYQL